MTYCIFLDGWSCFLRVLVRVLVRYALDLPVAGVLRDKENLSVVEI